MNDFSVIKEKVIPYFIQVHGEEYRDLIIERINKIVPIFYDTFETIEKKYYDRLSMKELELTFKFLEMNNIFVSKEVKDSVLKENCMYLIDDIEIRQLLQTCFSNDRYNGLNNFKNFVNEPYNNDNLDVILKNIRILNELGVFFNNYNDWFRSNEAKKILKKISKISKTIEILNLEYEEFEKSNKEIEEYVLQCTAIKEKTEKKFFLKFLKFIKHYLPREYKNKMKEASIKDITSIVNHKEFLKIVGDSLNYEGDLLGFSSVASMTLCDPTISEFLKKDIIRQKMNYFKFIGIDSDGMTDEEFLNSEKVVKHTPFLFFVDLIFFIKGRYKEQYEKELLKLISTYQSNVETINKIKNLKADKLCTNMLNNQSICICPYSNEDSEIGFVLFFSEGAAPINCADITLIHEINHAIETDIIEVSNKKVKYKVGFEVDFTNEKRRYEIFSEVINQMIAIKVTEAMHKDGVYIFDNPKYAKVHNTTDYDINIPVVSDFFSEFIEVIKVARKEKNLDSLYEVVGKENFEELNVIVNKYNYLSNTEEIIFSDLNKVEEINKKREELLKNSSIVYENMIEYSMPVKKKLKWNI